MPEPQHAPRLYRNRHGRLLGGVAGALADHLGVRRRLVRLAFVLLSFSAGLGVLLYGAFWIVLRTRPEDEAERLGALERRSTWWRPGRPRLVLLINAHTLPLGWWFVPSLLACFGAALLWRQASETERERWRRLSSSSLAAGATDRIGWLRIIAGVTLVLTGAVFILARAGISAAGAGLAAVLVTAGGLALITGPWWLKLVRELSTERRERIRNEERADIAAHLHDSVLQTLALIQRNAHQPREVARLARRQERELRTKLYGTGVPNGRFAAALHAAAAEVEDTYAITVDVVVVGDHPTERPAGRAGGGQPGGAGQRRQARAGDERVGVCRACRRRAPRCSCAIGEPASTRTGPTRAGRASAARSWAGCSASTAPRRSGPVRAREPKCNCGWNWDEDHDERT